MRGSKNIHNTQPKTSQFQVSDSQCPGQHEAQHSYPIRAQSLRQGSAGRAALCEKVSAACHMLKCLMGLDLKACVWPDS